MRYGKLIGGMFLLALVLGYGSGCGGVGAQPDASLGETPSKGPVGRTIRGASPKFLACARDSVTIQTGSTQELKLRFAVGAEGQVLKAGIEEMSSPDPDLRACVLKTLRKLRFPAPKDRQSKEISYPLVLKPE